MGFFLIEIGHLMLVLFSICEAFVIVEKRSGICIMFYLYEYEISLGRIDNTASRANYN